ncbi:hypothetical protein STEG23_030252, partial [Scotinomys teguina]
LLSVQMCVTSPGFHVCPFFVFLRRPGCRVMRWTLPRTSKREESNDMSPQRERHLTCSSRGRGGRGHPFPGPGASPCSVHGRRNPEGSIILCRFLPAIQLTQQESFTDGKTEK